MNVDSYTLSDAFDHYILTKHPEPVTKSIAEFLRAGELSKSGLKKLTRELGMSLPSLKEDFVELLFFYIEYCLKDHRLSHEEKLSIRHFKILFGIREADLCLLRKEAIKDLLATEIKRILSDQIIDDVESLYQADLQEVFGLSYDQFLEFTNEPVQALINDWIRRIASDGAVSEKARDLLYLQILTLDRLYKFTKHQTRILENKQRPKFETPKYSETSHHYEEDVPEEPGPLHAYSILGICTGVPFEEIRTAFKRLAQLNHPDKVAQMAPEIREVAETRMKVINAAYSELKETYLAKRS